MLTMKRMKRHKIKKEKQECSSSEQREQEEHDLACYIHDRVELMHQVFSMLKYKELKTMTPECVRNLAIGDLQELCTEELLGISSKRLLAILDGAEPPSDTESSSPSPPPDHLETISLDSISSDEELLASSSKKKKHKHRSHSTKSKSKKKEKSKEPDTQPDENAELSKASRAGLTVLELLELQARARAIRAQLQQEQANKLPSETIAVHSSHHSSDNEVEIKEEPPDVVEISSEDEKPDVNKLQKNIADVDKTTSTNEVEVETETVQGTETQSISQTFTKRINDLIITVPQTKPTRKIKLNRRMNKVIVAVQNGSESAPAETRSVTIVTNIVAEKLVDNPKNMPEKSNESKAKKKKRDKKKKTKVEKDGSDHDEITLQLSDSEKMDLFEDLDDSRRNYDKVSSSSEDSEGSSSDSDTENSSKDTSAEIPHSFVQNESSSGKNVEEKYNNTSKNVTIEPTLIQADLPTKDIEDQDKNTSEDTFVRMPHILIETKSSSIKNVEEEDDLDKNCSSLNESNSKQPKEITVIKEQQNCKSSNNASQNIIDNLSTENESDAINGLAEIVSQKNYLNKDNSMLVNETKDPALEQHTSTTNSVSCCVRVVENFSDIAWNPLNKSDMSSKPLSTEEKFIDSSSVQLVDKPAISNSATNDAESQISHISKDSHNDNELIKESQNQKSELSDGELTDRQSSEVEAMDVQPEIVCISDEESPKNKIGKKKKKKDKKSKKEKKSKKNKLDFREADDQNFYKDANKIEEGKNQTSETLSPSNEVAKFEEKTIDLDSDEVYEILEHSDDSSCYEVEGTVLSKEPTAEEIEALSAKIDEIEREEVVTDEQICLHEKLISEKESSECQNSDFISWKDRYLDSKKVKKVLTTANIFNALRKKNKELKKKIEDSKKKDGMKTPTKEYVQSEINIQLEGSIQQYNALEGSTKYVNPVEEPNEEKEDALDNIEECERIVTKGSEEEHVTKEMKKDAKQLLKMYKRLLKHNDMNMQKDPNRKKKKKQKKRVKHDSENNVKIADSM